jgi:flagellar biosynthesis/type III secretory pathway M-ring protein FliF/YscJ
MHVQDPSIDPMAHQKFRLNKLNRRAELIKSGQMIALIIGCVILVGIFVLFLIWGGEEPYDPPPLTWIGPDQMKMAAALGAVLICIIALQVIMHRTRKEASELKKSIKPAS